MIHTHTHTHKRRGTHLGHHVDALNGDGPRGHVARGAKLRAHAGRDTGHLVLEVLRRKGQLRGPHIVGGQLEDLRAGGGALLLNERGNLLLQRRGEGRGVEREDCASIGGEGRIRQRGGNWAL